MYAIKIMSGEDKADSDVGKGFKMIVVDAGDTFEFGHDPHTGLPQVTVTGYRDGEHTCITYPVTGNAYVLSDSGKTIASFWARSLWEEYKTLKIEVDANDPDPENTIANIQAMVMEKTGNSLYEMTTKYRDRGLTNMQLMILSEPKLNVMSNEVARGKHYRARVASLMSQGIPQDIAMENSWYLTQAV